LVETKAEDLILDRAKTETVGFLVVGDPFGFVTFTFLTFIEQQHIPIL
jgi:diphthamide biosynthesis methyltransferase